MFDDLSFTLQPLSHSRKVTNSIFYRYFYGISSNVLHSLLPPFRPLQMEHALLFPHYQNTLIPTRELFLKTVTLWNKLLRGCSPHITSQESIVIFPFHPRNLHLLTTSLPFLLHNSFRITILLNLPLVPLETCIELVYKTVFIFISDVITFQPIYSPTILVLSEILE